jgi:hypothetical protein
MGHTPVIGVTLYESFESEAVGEDRHGADAGQGRAGRRRPLHVCRRLRPAARHLHRAQQLGADWGDKGDCYFPEAYLGSPLYGSDYWIVTGEG